MRPRVFTTALLLSLAASAALPAVASTATPPSRASATSAAAAIDRAAAEIRTFAGANRLLLLGEFHGTREIPQVVARLVDAYAAEGPVVLGLEVDHREQAALDAYLRSDGGKAARAALAARPFWHRTDDRHDGRRSHDMLDLVEHVRRLRADGRDVALLAYDAASDAVRVDRDARDRAMAARLRAAIGALPRGRLLVLAGNVHAMKERPAYLPAAAGRPAGSWLRDLAPFSVRITAREGHWWGCTATDCSPRRVDGSAAGTGRAHGAFDALIVLPRFTVARLIGAQPAP